MPPTRLPSLATGAEALTISGTALNIDNLHTFTGTRGRTGGLNVTFTNADGLGHVAATGGSGVNTFTFDDTAAGAASFTVGLHCQWRHWYNKHAGHPSGYTEQSSLAGVGANITNIATIEHNTAGGADRHSHRRPEPDGLGHDVRSGMEPITPHTVTVSNITNAQTVEFSGTVRSTDLTLDARDPGRWARSSTSTLR